MERNFLNEEERRIYEEATYTEKEYEDLKKELVLQNDGMTTYVLCKCKRDTTQIPQANFKDTGLALKGVLAWDETLDEFIIHTLKMRKVIEFRTRDWDRIKYK